MRRFLACFGNGHLGRLGLGHACVSERFPRVLGTLVGYSIKQVACGGAHTAVVSDDGSLFTFGQNESGQLGHSCDDPYVPVPLEVGLPDGAKLVAAGEHHTLCLSDSGDVWAFGSNACGQLGIGPAKESRMFEPRLVKGLQGAKVVALSAGSTHSMALTAQGEVYSWGQSDWGALGHGAGSVRQVQWTPRLIQALASKRVRSLASGYFSSGCIDGNGRAYTWGNGLYWQLGHGEAAHEFAPRQVEGLNVCGSLSIGQMHALATGFDGNVLVWGTDNHGTLGQGEGVTNWQKVPLKGPKAVGKLSSIKVVTCGWKHSVAVGSDGRLFSWGWNGAYHTDPGTDNGSGQLGLGDDTDRWAPNQLMRIRTNDKKYYDLRMPVLKPWKAVQASAGRNHTAVIIEADIHLNDIQ